MPKENVDHANCSDYVFYYPDKFFCHLIEKPLEGNHSEKPTEFHIGKKLLEPTLARNGDAAFTRSNAITSKLNIFTFVFLKISYSHQS